VLNMKDVDQLSGGVYFINVITKRGITTQKVLKQN
jgi:hypothetical protein